ncbi:MAG: hypothetical protein LBQ44_07495 [Treponema sp.]|nr:hypothetical protein [Treponema sp.]
MKKAAAFFFLAASFLYAQAEPDGGGQLSSGPITSVEVSGLKRTKPRITDYALEKFIGREGETLDLNEVKAAVIDTGVLEPVSVELVRGEEGLILTVQVEEKWSLFPIPIATITSGGANFGLLLMDTNAGGLKDQAAVGGMYGSDGWMAMLMYRNTPDRRGFPGWNAAFFYNRRNQGNQSRWGETLRSYEAVLLSGRLGLDYPLTDHLNLSFNLSLTDLAITKRLFNAPESGYRTIGFAPGLSLRYSNWDGYLLSERSLSFAYGYKLALEGSSGHEFQIRGNYGVSLVPGFLLKLRGGGVLRPGGDALSESALYQGILPANFYALNYAAVQGGLEKYLFKFRMGTLSATASWQFVLSSSLLSGLNFDHGPAGGIRFYLSRLAIPALDFGAAYNMVTGIPQFSLNLGMGF